MLTLFNLIYSALEMYLVSHYLRRGGHCGQERAYAGAGKYPRSEYLRRAYRYQYCLSGNGHNEPVFYKEKFRIHALI